MQRHMPAVGGANKAKGLTVVAARVRVVAPRLNGCEKNPPIVCRGPMAARFDTCSGAAVSVVKGRLWRGSDGGAGEPASGVRQVEEVTEARIKTCHTGYPAAFGTALCDGSHLSCGGVALNWGAWGA